MKNQMTEAVQEMGQELNRDLIEDFRWYEQKHAEGHITVQRLEEKRKDINRQRIAALGLFLIPGGEYDKK